MVPATPLESGRGTRNRNYRAVLQIVFLQMYGNDKSKQERISLHASEFITLKEMSQFYIPVIKETENSDSLDFFASGTAVNMVQQRIKAGFTTHHIRVKTLMTEHFEAGRTDNSSRQSIGSTDQTFSYHTLIDASKPSSFVLSVCASAILI